MKIGLIIEQLDLTKGGQERSTLEIAELLIERGVQVAVVTARAENLPTTRARIIDLGIPARRRGLRYLKFVRQAERIISKESFDLVHAITPIPSANVYQPRGGLIQETFERNLARHCGGMRLIRRIVGPNFRQRMVRRAEKNLADKTDCRFLAVSDYVRNQLHRHLNVADDRIETIFNGVDLARLPESIDPAKRDHLREMLKIQKDQIIGVFAATNFKLKGLDTVIRAAAYLKERHPQEYRRLKFLVSGPDKGYAFFKKVNRTGLDEAFIFSGPTQDMGQLYHLADFLIHPTWYDPCSRVVLEALACRLPAISTRYNGASELLRRADCGLVMDNPGDAEELAKYCTRLLDPTVRNRFIEKARPLRKQISMESHVDYLLKFYQAIKSKKV